jgi:Ricin-type beta-trefoil lectin domain-like
MASSYVIVSRLNGFALAAEGGNSMPGVRVAPFPRTGDISQQFYDDASTGTIRSALNNLCLDIEG